MSFCCTAPTPAAWDDVDELDLATLSWVQWFNEQRLHGHCNDVPPAGFEAAFYAAHKTGPTGLETQPLRLDKRGQKPGRFSYGPQTV